MRARPGHSMQLIALCKHVRHTDGARRPAATSTHGVDCKQLLLQVSAPSDAPMILWQNCLASSTFMHRYRKST